MARGRFEADETGSDSFGAVGVSIEAGEEGEGIDVDRRGCVVGAILHV